MEADDRRSQRHILEREAHHRDFARTFDRTIARSVGHEFSLKSLKEATGLVERMIKHRAIIPDDKMKERYGILFFDAPFRDMLRVGGAFKDFNEFSENTLISGRPSQMSLI